MGFKKRKKMKKSEFLKIKKEFETEEKRWKNIKPGDLVYENQWGDYFEIVVSSVNVDNRYINGIDKSQGGKKVKSEIFDTLEELKRFGITFK